MKEKPKNPWSHLSWAGVSAGFWIIFTIGVILTWYHADPINQALFPDRDGFIEEIVMDILCVAWMPSIFCSILAIKRNSGRYAGILWLAISLVFNPFVVDMFAIFFINSHR